MVIVDSSCGQLSPSVGSGSSAASPLVALLGRWPDWDIDASVGQSRQLLVGLDSSFGHDPELDSGTSCSVYSLG